MIVTPCRGQLPCLVRLRRSAWSARTFPGVSWWQLPDAADDRANRHRGCCDVLFLRAARADEQFSRTGTGARSTGRTVRRSDGHGNAGRLRQKSDQGGEESRRRPADYFFWVTLPLILPGAGSGARFAFATSFDEVVLTLLLVGPEQSTLPRQMIAGIRENVSPAIAAVATIPIVISISILLTLEWLRGRA